MADESKKWGRGRVAVIAMRETLRADIAAGYPLTEVYQRHRDQLGGIQYVHFTRLVRRLMPDVLPPRGRPIPSPLPLRQAVSPEPSKPAEPSSNLTGPSDATRQPSSEQSRTFRLNPVVGPDDRERFFPKRKD